VALVAVNHLHRDGRTQRALRQQLAALAAAPDIVEIRLSKFEAVGVRLSEAGIRWKPVAKLSCAAPRPLVGSFLVEVCNPGHER
jgi:hypothetical protein